MDPGDILSRPGNSAIVLVLGSTRQLKEAECGQPHGKALCRGRFEKLPQFPSYLPFTPQPHYEAEHTLLLTAAILALHWIRPHLVHSS